MSLNSFKDLSCRLCLSKEKLQVSIFSEYGIENNIAKKISICLPVDVTVVEKDEFSKTICNKCLCKLNLNYNFFLQTLKTSRIFKNKDSQSSEEKDTSETFDSINEFPRQQIVNSPTPIELDKTTQIDSSNFQVNQTTEIDDFEIPVPPTDRLERPLEDILEDQSEINSEFSPSPVMRKSQQLEKDNFGEFIVWSVPSSCNEIPNSQISNTKCKSHHKKCHRRRKHSKNCSKNQKQMNEANLDGGQFKMVVDESPDLFNSPDFFGFE